MAQGISGELQRRLLGQRTTQREALVLLVATMLDVRSANLMELATALSRAAERTDMRYQWVVRVLTEGHHPQLHEGRQHGTKCWRLPDRRR